MIGEPKDDLALDEVEVEVDDDVEIEDPEEIIDSSELSVDAVNDDNVGDISVEINVEELVAKLEATDDNDVAQQREIRKRLDELEEQRKDSEELDSTYNFNLDDELA